MPQYDLSGKPLPEDNTPKTPRAGDPLASSSTAPQTDMAGNPLPPRPASPPVWQASSGPLNTAGARGRSQMSGAHDGVPPQVAAFQWNWGAFLLPWLWAFNHKLPAWGVGMLALFLLSFVPLVNIVTGLISFGLAVYLGLNGHKLAWENRRFDGGVTQFISVQSAWMGWGFGSLMLIPVMAAILFPVFNQARERAREKSGYYRTHPRPAASGTIYRTR